MMHCSDSAQRHAYAVCCKHQVDHEDRVEGQQSDLGGVQANDS